MDARLVWNTWRRILTSDAIVDAVLKHHDYGAAAPGLASEGRAILADYANTPAATDTMIGAYRRGLVRNSLNALRLVPLTQRLLHTSELDVEAVTADFIRSIHYMDDGPNFWKIAASFVAYLAKLPDFPDPCSKTCSPSKQRRSRLSGGSATRRRRCGRKAPSAI